MYLLNTIRLIASPVRWRSIIKSTTSSGHVHLLGHNIIPDTSQIFHQLLFACLGIYIRYSCIQIICTYGMPHCTILVAERNTILIIIRSVFHHTANINQVLRKFQITGISCGTIHFDHSHIMWRANGITSQFGRSRFVKVAQKICCFYGSIKKSSLSGGTTMHNTRHHQVSQVICLKVQPIGKSSFFILVTYFRSNDRLFMLILQCMRVNPFIQFFDNNRRMYITVCTLGFYDTSNKVIH